MDAYNYKSIISELCKLPDKKQEINLAEYGQVDNRY